MTSVRRGDPLPFLPLLSYHMRAYTVSGHGVMGAWDEIILLAVVLSAFGLYAWFMRRNIKQRQKPPEAAQLDRDLDDDQQ